MENVLTLNRQQLELLQDFTNYPILQIFETPHNPTQVARRLNIPANRLHYRVKKLYELGLLELVSQQGRSRNYQTLAKHFRVHRDIYQTQYTLGMTKDLFKKVSQGFELAEQDYIAKGTDKASEYIHFGLDSTGEHLMENFEPCLGVFEMPMTQAQYHKLTQTLLEVAREFSKDTPVKNSKACTVALVAFARSSTFTA